MLGMPLLVMAITLTSPCTPLAGLMGFTPLSIPYLLVIFGLVAMYFLSAELAKRWFYRKYGV